MICSTVLSVMVILASGAEMFVSFTADKKSANSVKINGAIYNVLIGIMDFTQKSRI